MEEYIRISNINDFVFCPLSIYYHELYGNQDNLTFQTSSQLNGKSAHESIDEKLSVTSKLIVGIDVYCEKYHLCGKIDTYNKETKTLCERKNKVSKVYDGQVFQLYAQYFALKEMQYDVRKLVIWSKEDNKTYDIRLPEEDNEMLKKFENTIEKMESFDIFSFTPDSKNKCDKCIYNVFCDRCLENDNN